MKLKRLTSERSLSSRLYDEIESLIVSGNLKAGDRLPTEADLCRQLGVSRTSLREALQQLKGRGLIESTAGRGMFVRSIEPKMIEKDLKLFAQVEEDPQAFFELVDLRLMIEPENTRQVAKHCSPELMTELERLLDEMQANLTNVSAFMEADLDMHLALARHGGNRFVNMLLCCLKPLGKRFGYLNHESGAFMLETLSQHKIIVETLHKGDSRAAHKAMRDHLLASSEHFKTNYAAEDQAVNPVTDSRNYEIT